jgi:hypothetical protein
LMRIERGIDTNPYRAMTVSMRNNEVETEGL